MAASQKDIAGVYLIKVNDEIKYLGECMNLSTRFNSGYGIFHLEIVM